MRSLPLSALLLAATPAALSPGDRACLSSHARQLAELAHCGDRTSLRLCLSNLPGPRHHSDLQACYADAGCPASQAAQEAVRAVSRCRDRDGEGDADAYAYAEDELRRRRAAGVTPRPALNHDHRLAARETGGASLKSGSDCFRFGTTTHASCVTSTVDGKPKANSCTPQPVTTSDCLSGWICALDPQHQDICMKAQNALDTGGVVVAVIFGLAIVVGVAYVTFACCQERAHHKKAAAKAEAVALARAATKKQRSQEARAPLMQQVDDAHDNGPNPFQEPGHR
ncbi:uncharacterized protein UV8b_00090 [Ustilaginoidea virens]|uniref:Uncharacterized protein n=1 Tax=Ustilaginoidea virens TaxID=1159556 RepID=A0A8E5HI67_USTVR|nr:uncharacterized protein UV8b_00090 [Ustilaginoidea virens]QUC15849.1 hypothetical protein UV8b_00090 [Ustilaginoidea virens]